MAMRITGIAIDAASDAGTVVAFWLLGGFGGVAAWLSVQITARLLARL